jgi:hypothetical protein
LTATPFSTTKHLRSVFFSIFFQFLQIQPTTDMGSSSSEEKKRKKKEKKEKKEKKRREEEAAESAARTAEKKEKKKDKKKNKKKKDKKRRSREEDSSDDEERKKKVKKEKKIKKPEAAAEPTAVPVPAAPPVDLSKLSVDEKRKLLGAARAAKAKAKQAYSGGELADPQQQAKFNKFLRLSSGAPASGAYEPGQGTGENLEEKLTSQFNKSLQYQFGSGNGAPRNKKRGLGAE